MSTKGNTQKLATLFEDTNALTKVKEVMEPRPMDIKQHEASCLEEGTGASSSSSGANPGDVGSDVASASGFAQEAGPVSVAMEQDLIAPSTPAKSRAPRVGAPAMAFSSATAGGIPLGRVALPVASRKRKSSPAQCQDRERTALSAFSLLSHGHTHKHTVMDIWRYCLHSEPYHCNISASQEVYVGETMHLGPWGMWQPWLQNLSKCA